MDQEQLIYEEEEVVWAKIRGYPWWPAFVISEIHQNSSDEIEYTVVFFGDNTKKFIDNYIDCFSKAKTHRKLMMSIMMAEEKLRQNDQNVEIFEELRTRIKSKKGKPPTKDCLQSSEHVSEQGQFKNKKKANENQIYEEPEESQKQLPKKQVKIKQKPIAKQKTQFKKKKNNNNRKKVELNQESIQEEEPESEMKAEKEQVDAQKRRQQQIKQKKQSFIKKAAVSIRTFDIAIQVKNGEIIQRKQSQVFMKAQQQSKNEKSKQQLRQPSSKKKEQQQQKQMSEELNADQINKKKRGRKAKNQKQAIIANDQQQNCQKKQFQIKNKNKQQDQTKKCKKNKDVQPPSLQKHATQPLPEKDESEGQGSEQINHEDSQSLSSQFRRVKRKGRSASSGQVVNSISRPIIFPRKRGRPKKIDIVRQIDQDADSQKEDRNENIPTFKKKQIRKALLPSKQPQRPRQKSIADQAVINGVKKLLHNRKALIEFLSQSTINVDNVKEILDMDVSNILQQGVINDQVIHLLEIFRAALLYKYFPDDVKHRKKYQKLLKKKHYQQQRQEVEDQVQQLPQIRKKTINKVKKFLGMGTEEESKLIQISQKIEQLIYVNDQDLGNHYCRIAFLVLSALKQKKQSYQQIIRKLQSKYYD